MPGGINLAWGGAAVSNAGADTTTSTGTTATANAAGNTKGSYAQLVASTPADAIGLLVTCGPGSSTGRYSVDIAVGAGGSEVNIVADLMINLTSNLGGAHANFIPLQIPAGTRISARQQCTTAVAATLKISTQLIDSGFDGIGALGACDTYGFVSGSTKGTTIDPGAVGNTKGSWVQMVASTTRDIQALGVCFDGGGGSAASRSALVDVGVGAGGSEQVLIPNIQETCSSSLSYTPGTMLLFPVHVPAATRLAVRSQCSSTTASQRNSTVTLYGFS